MPHDIAGFFRVQRRIFGVCPACSELFRLSDAKVYLKTKPGRDWMEDLTAQQEKLDRARQRLEEREETVREAARAAGRRAAARVVRRIDRVFTPRSLNPDDAKVLFHPIDYVVFNGLKKGAVRNLLLLDRQTRHSDHRSLQISIEKTVERGNLDWVTLRVGEGGVVEEE